MDKGKKRNKDKEVVDTIPQKKQQKKSDDKGTSYFFCGAKEYKKKHCANYQAWCANKGMLLNLVCSEVSLISVPRYMWLIDSNATIDISLPMQGCLDCRKPNDDERYIYMGDGKKVEVKAIGKFKLLLKVRFNLDLNKIFITSSFRFCVEKNTLNLFNVFIFVSYVIFI